MKPSSTAQTSHTLTGTTPSPHSPNCPITCTSASLQTMHSTCSAWRSTRWIVSSLAKYRTSHPASAKSSYPFADVQGIGVFNVGGSFYALRNICPHKTGPLCTGEITGRITTTAPPSTGAPLEIEGDGEVLHCPWHQWAFEITTGRCLVDPEVRVKTYPVKIEGDEVVVTYDD